jgi:small membrane protein A
MIVQRHFFCTLLFAAFLLVGLFAPQPGHAARMEQQYVTKVLNLMEGDWYDADGNRVLQIGGGYINGCRVLAAYDFAGGSSHGAGRFDILESTGSRSLYLTWDIRHVDTDSIKLNDHQMLHRTAKPPFNESIAGIHLGMTSAEVTAVLGAPPQTGDLRPYVGTYGWYYPDLRIAVTFDADTVDRILLLKGSRAILERSGLNCENAPYEFAQAYQMKHVPQVRYDDSNVFTGCYAIGGEEYLSFGNRMEYVMLSKYWN